jgi:carbon catabolite-derepressing protein kinase
MLEIYRTLKTLGFEWKHKEPEKSINMQDYDDFANDFGGTGNQSRNGGGNHESTNGDDAKKRKRREEEEFLKKAQALFFIETRCRLDDVMVRMDLQLYSIDSENYLVDFRNVGYKLLQESPLPTHSANMLRRGSVEDGTTDEELASLINTVRERGTPSKATRFEDDHHPPGSAPSPLKAGSLEGTGGISTPINSGGDAEPNMMRARQGSQDATIRQLWEATARAKNQAMSGHQSLPNSSLPSSLSSPGRHQNVRDSRRRPGMPRRASSREKGNVSSPFLFLECACRLIVELGEYTHTDTLLALLACYRN